MKRSRDLRRGLASLEEVLVTALTIPLAAIIAILGLRVAANFYRLVATCVDWPYL